jgi:hypothetical protein
MRGEFRWGALLTVLATVTGCAENVGHRVGAVQDDQRQFAAMLAVEPVQPASVFAKSSSVSSSITYAGVHAQKVQEKGVDASIQLGYTQVVQRPTAERAVHVICHRSEPGRSVTLNRGLGTMEVMFRVSGWRHDQEVCPGNADRS